MWSSASPCRWPKNRMVPVLIRPDGSMTLTRWPSSRSMGECGTKTRWSPLSLLHDLTLELHGGHRVHGVKVIKLHRAPFNVLAKFPNLQPISGHFARTLWATTRRLVVSTETTAGITGCSTDYMHNRDHLIVLQSRCAGTRPQRNSLMGGDWFPSLEGSEAWLKTSDGAECYSHLPEQSSNTSPLSS